MFPQIYCPLFTTPNFLSLAHYKEVLRSKGWTLRAAGPALGVCFSHLHRVLQGERTSARLLAAIEALPMRERRKKFSR